MKEIRANDNELDELILILQMSSYDADVAMAQSHDIEEIDALREHKRTARKWLGRFTSLKNQTPSARSEGAKSGWDIRRAREKKG